MDPRAVFRYLGALAIGTAFFIALCIPWAIYYGEYAALGHLSMSVGICIVMGGALWLAGRGAAARVSHRGALFIVATGWAMVVGLGAIPYVVSGLLGPVEGYFESMSGFTTTGSSVLTALDSAPRSIVFWRSLTHWLGGLGIVLLLIAILPYLGTGGKILFLRESTGPTPHGIRPRVRETAQMLYKIYLGLTILGTVWLMLAGMDLYEALNHCFAALATGGFSTRYDSVASFDSLFIEIVLIAICLLGGTNFSLFFGLWRGNWRAFVQDTEFRVYIGFFAVVTLLITVNLMGAEVALPQVQAVERAGDTLVAPGTSGAGYPQPRAEYSLGTAMRMAAFHVSSVMTTTGFVTDNTDLWPYASRSLLLLVASSGACVGSTGGGLKVMRVIILAKLVYCWMEHTFRPKRVRAIRVNGMVIDEGIQRRVGAFFALYMAWMAFSVVVMSFMGLPLDSAVSATISTLNNIGPGLEFVGACTDYSLVPAAGKAFLSLNMLVGRLELVTVLALFTPAFWKRN